MRKLLVWLSTFFTIVVLVGLGQHAPIFFAFEMEEPTFATKKTNLEPLYPYEEMDSNKPDLAPLPPSQLRMWRVGKKIELRFTAAIWNTGKGPLEVIGKEQTKLSKDQDVPVSQRLYLPEGGSVDFPIGELFWHGAHYHYHLDNVALYTLEPASTTVAETIHNKTSFCLWDNAAHDRTLKSAPRRGVYTVCSVKKQGISVGWADIYGYTLPGQGIDVTNMPAGDYRLIIEVDPNSMFIEETKENNVKSAIIRMDPKRYTVKIIAIE